MKHCLSGFFLALFLLASSRINQLSAQQSVVPLGLVTTQFSTFPFTQKVQFWGSLINTPTPEEAIPLSLASLKSWSSSDRPYAYKVEDLAFFCRLEVQLEKATKIPVRFRIGDVQQVDYLEGKFEGWRYGY